MVRSTIVKSGFHCSSIFEEGNPNMKVNYMNPSSFYYIDSGFLLPDVVFNVPCSFLMSTVHVANVQIWNVVVNMTWI